MEKLDDHSNNMNKINNTNTTIPLKEESDLVSLDPRLEAKNYQLTQKKLNAKIESIFNTDDKFDFMGLKDSRMFSRLYKQLIVEWSKEKFCEQLLPYQETMIKQTSEAIEKYRNNVLNESIKKSGYDFLSEIYEMDLERLVYLFKDYLRIRLVKIQHLMYYVIKNDYTHLLSENEFDYAYNLFKMKRAYFQHILFKNVHPSISEFTQGLSPKIVVEPNYKAYCFIKILNEGVTINLKDIFETIDEGIIYMTSGQIYCIPQILVKDNWGINQIAFV